MTIYDIFEHLFQGLTSFLIDLRLNEALQIIRKEDGTFYLKIKDKYLDFYEKNTGATSSIIEFSNFDDLLSRAKQIQNMLKRVSYISKRESIDKINLDFIHEIISEIDSNVFIKEKLYPLCQLQPLNKFVHIYSVKVQNFYAIEKVIIENVLGKKEIYFLGENGDGKTLILMAIHLVFNAQDIIVKSDFENTGKIIDIIKSNKTLRLIGQDESGLDFYLFESYLKYPWEKSNYIENFFAYGTHRGRYDSDDFEKYGFMSLYDENQKLYNPQRLLINAYINDLQKKNRNREEEILEIGLSLDTIKSLFTELLENNVEIEVTSRTVSFKEKGYSIPFNHLSEGYKNLLIWVSDLLYRLQENQPHILDLVQYKGVVLVDEIEQHLHPLWQQKIVKKLRGFFPNIQFFFTTHSPTIIQGASDDAVIYKVYRNPETGKTNLSEPYHKKDLSHMMFNTLVTSPLFGLDNARMKNNVTDVDTSDSYLQSKIAKRVSKALEEKKKAVLPMLSELELDELIDDILKTEDTISDNGKD